MTNYPYSVIVRLWENIQPLDRGSRYEDPLQAALGSAGAGRVTGGGSQLNEFGAIKYAEVEISLADLEGAIDLVRITLEAAGAPGGSELHLPNDRTQTFGKLQCLAIHLDGAGLPPEVYASFDGAKLVEQLESALNLGGRSFRGVWVGPEETALYFYGPNAEDMFAHVEPTLTQWPIAQNARVVLRYGNPALEPRSVRVPRR